MLTVAALMLPAARANPGAKAPAGQPVTIGQLLAGAACVSTKDSRICDVPPARLEGFEPGRKRFLLAGGTILSAPTLGDAPQSAHSHRVFGGHDMRGKIFQSDGGKHLRHLVDPAVRAATPPGMLQTAHCIMGAAAYNDGGLLRVRDDLVRHYAAHGVKLTASSSAAELRACTDEDFDGTTTAAELVRLMTSKCITFPDPQPPSLVTVESRRDLLRGC